MLKGLFQLGPVPRPYFLHAQWRSRERAFSRRFRAADAGAGRRQALPAMSESH
jgi:hypothetical protein